MYWKVKFLDRVTFTRKEEARVWKRAQKKGRDCDGVVSFCGFDFLVGGGLFRVWSRLGIATRATLLNKLRSNFF